MTQTGLECLFLEIMYVFRILNFGHCDLPFDLAQGGELVEPFDICDLGFGISGLSGLVKFLNNNEACVKLMDGYWKAVDLSGQK